MRLLEHQPYELRLGWLRVIARLVGDGPIGPAELANRLFQTATRKTGGHPAQELWIEQADLTVAPTGMLSTKTAPGLVVMASKFGVYDGEAESSTDLGSALAAVDAEVHGEMSPFRWSPPVKLLGLRILLGADGDLTLEILRRWPEERVLDDPLSFIASCAGSLVGRAETQAQRRELSRLSRTRPRDEKREAYLTVVYPALEPLRELGYVERSRSLDGRTAKYVLSPSGLRLQEALREHCSQIEDASILMNAALSRVFLGGEGILPSAAAEPKALRATLFDLPAALMGGSGVEAPLEPVVLLTQARLITEYPGAWIEVNSAKSMLGELARATEGRIGLKSGRSAWEANLTWSSTAELGDASLWQLPPKDDPPPAAFADRPYENGRAPGPEAPALATPPPAPPERPASAEPRPAPPEGDRTPPAPPSPPTVPPPLLCEPRVLLWLQHVGRLVEPPSMGGFGAFEPGGPRSWIVRLAHLSGMEPKYLDGKRAVQDLPWPGGKEEKAKDSPATYLLGRWLDALDEDRELAPIWIARESWKQPRSCVSSHGLRVALDAANRATGGLSSALQGRISRFLDEPRDPNLQAEDSAWARISLATAALIEDAIERNVARREELRHALHGLSAGGPSREVADSFLRRLVEPGAPEIMVVKRHLSVPRAVVQYIEAAPDHVLSFRRDGARIDMEPAGDSVRVYIAHEERTRGLALARADELVWDALKRVRFMATLQLGAGSLGGEEPPAGPLEPTEVMDAEANLIPPPEPAPPTRLLCAPLTFVWAPSSVIPADFADRLPALDASLRGTSLDAPTRLSQTLHWLAAAEQPEVRAAQRLSYVWVAVEHLITEPEEEHGPHVARTLADVGALCRLEALGGAVCRDLCEALARAARVRSGAAEVQRALAAWAGPIEAHLGGAALDAVRGAPAQAVPVTDAAGFSLLVAQLPELPAIAAVIDPESPLAALRVRALAQDIGKAKKLAAWLRRTRLEIQSLVLHAYEIRNLLFHDGATFGLDEAARLDNLHARFRLLVDAVMARAASEIAARSPAPAMAAVWAKLRFGVQELLHAADAALPPADTDRAGLLRSVLGRQGA
jgi:hypothetical protein